MNKNEKMIGQVDQAQIDVWKEEHKTRKINTIIQEDDEGNKHITYLKQPNFDLLNVLKAKAKKDQELEGLQTVFNSLRIGGSEEVTNDYHLHLGAIRAVGELLQSFKGSLGKL